MRPLRKACIECGRICPPGRNRCALHPKTAVRRDRPYLALRATILANATVCGVCGKPLHTDPADPPVLDHIWPRAHGGTDQPSNLQAAHRSCNARKSANLPGTLEHRPGGGPFPT